MWTPILMSLILMLMILRLNNGYILAMKMKYFIWLICGLILSPVVEFVEKYIFDDWVFVTFLGILILMDTFFGIYLGLKNRNISHKKFSKLMEKLLVYGSLLIITHIILNYSMDGSQNVFFQWVDNIMYAGIVCNESISILEKLIKIKPNKVPKFIKKRMESFSREGNFEDIFDGKDDSEKSQN